VTPRKIVRAMKARRSGQLGCGHFVTTGSLIVWVRGQGWMCTPCRLAQLADLAKAMREIPQPSERDSTEETA
jgi:hypothetical protein